MSITLELPDEIGADLRRHAERAGQTPDAYVAEAVRRQLAFGQLQESQQLEDIEWALATHREQM